MDSSQMRVALDKPSRSERKWRKRRECPGCGRRFHTWPAFRKHVWVSLLVLELGVSAEEANRLYREYGAERLSYRDDTGELILLHPEREESEL